MLSFGRVFRNGIFLMSALKMKVARVSRKYNIPRYQIDYWRKTGLLANSTPDLGFEDLLKLRFILNCRKQNVSLQRIRNFVKLNSQTEENKEFSHWKNRVRIYDSVTLLIEEENGLVHPGTGQLYFDYNEETAGPGRVISLETDTPGILIDLDSELSIEIDNLEKEFQKALSLTNEKEIEDILNRILKKAPDHLGANIELGNIGFEKGNYDIAQKFYERALEIQPDCAEAMYNLANLYFRVKKYAAAIRYYQSVIELDPEFPETYYNLALVYYSLKYLDQARILFERFTRLDPDSDWRFQAEQFIEDIDALQGAVSVKKEAPRNNLLKFDF